MAYLGTNSTVYDPTRTVAAPRDADRFSGNASTTAFTLSRSVQKAVDLEVYVENVRQEPLTAYDVNSTTLTFTGAPPSGTNNIYVVYRNFDSGAQVSVPDGSITYAKLANNIRIFTTDNLTPNGNNTVFTLTEPPADANTVMVTVDGVVQRAPVHYTTSGNTITFTSSPPAGANVHVRHLGFRTTSTITTLAANSSISQPTLLSPVISGNISVSGNVTSNILPAANATYDLGSSSSRWNNIYGNLVGNFSFPTTSVLANTVSSGQQSLSSSAGTYTDLNVSLSLDPGTWAVFYAASIENQNVSSSSTPVQGVTHYLSLRTSGGTVIQSSQLVYANYEKTYDWNTSTFMRIMTVASTTTYKLSHVWNGNSGSPTTSSPYCRPDNHPTQLIAIKLY